MLCFNLNIQLTRFFRFSVVIISSHLLVFSWCNFYVDHILLKICLFGDKIIVTICVQLMSVLLCYYCGALYCIIVCYFMVFFVNLM
jgi:hypothetical protein